MKTTGFDNADSSWSHVSSQYVMPCGMRKVGVVKTAGFDNTSSKGARVLLKCQIIFEYSTIDYYNA